MTRDEMLQQAYAYGSSIALQEMGLNKIAADTTAVKLAMSPAEIKEALKILLTKAQGEVGALGGRAAGIGRDIGGRAAGIGRDIGGRAAGIGRDIGGRAAGIGRDIGGRAAGIGRGVARTVEPPVHEVENLLAALQGGMPYPSTAAFSPERLTRAARGGLGAGLIGGAGLGVGGTLGTQALLEGLED